MGQYHKCLEPLICLIDIVKLSLLIKKFWPLLTLGKFNMECPGDLSYAEEYGECVEWDKATECKNFQVQEWCKLKAFCADEDYTRGDCLCKLFQHPSWGPKSFYICTYYPSFSHCNYQWSLFSVIHWRLLLNVWVNKAFVVRMVRTRPGWKQVRYWYRWRCTFGWCPPQSAPPPPQLWSKYQFFVGKITPDRGVEHTLISLIVFYTFWRLLHRMEKNNKKW